MGIYLTFIRPFFKIYEICDCYETAVKNNFNDLFFSRFGTVHKIQLI